MPSRIPRWIQASAYNYTMILMLVFLESVVITLFRANRNTTSAVHAQIQHSGVACNRRQEYCFGRIEGFAGASGAGQRMRT